MSYTTMGDSHTDHLLMEMEEWFQTLTEGELGERQVKEPEGDSPLQRQLLETLSRVLGSPGAPEELSEDMRVLVRATVNYQTDFDTSVRVHHAGHRKTSFEEYQESVSADRAAGLQVVELPVYEEDGETINHRRAYVRFQLEDGSWSVREWQWFPRAEHMQDGAYHGDVIVQRPDFFARWMEKVPGAAVIDIRSGPNDPVYLVKLGTAMMMVRGVDWDPFEDKSTCK